jgi:hypothetical protein
MKKKPPLLQRKIAAIALFFGTPGLPDRCARLPNCCHRYEEVGNGAPGGFQALGATPTLGIFHMINWHEKDHPVLSET